MACTGNPLTDPNIQELLDEIQEGIPLTENPFRSLGGSLGWTEKEVLSRLLELKEIGVLLRVGPILDTHNLGYASTLAAISSPFDEVKRLAERVGRWMTVTHCYERKHRFNLWFTLTMRSNEELDQTIERCREMGEAKQLRDLRTVKKYKVDSRYPLRRKRFSPVPPRISAQPPQHNVLQLLALLAEGLELIPRPFKRPADSLGVTQEELLQQLSACMAAGYIRRISGVLSHRALGFRHHLLCIKEPPINGPDSLAEALQDHVEISHIYLREDKGQDHQVFCAMVHCRSEAHWLQLREKIPILQTFQPLETTRCYKRSPFRLGIS